MAEIYVIDTELFLDSRLYEIGQGLLSTQRQKQLLSLKNPAAARRSLGAGVVLFFALQAHGFAGKQEEILLTKYGKPYLPHRGFHFSLSHSGNLAICAVSDLPIGADLQEVKPALPKHLHRILSEGERAYLARLPKEEQVELFYRLWARKESLAKWDGRGIRLPFAELSFLEAGRLQDSIPFVGNILWVHEEKRFLPKYALSLCSSRPFSTPTFSKITAETLKKP